MQEPTLSLVIFSVAGLVICMALDALNLGVQE